MLAMRWWVLLAIVTCASSVSTQLHVSNPMRRVVTMLLMMQKKITDEGETEQELFNKYMCYCKSSEETLAKSIMEGETKIPQLESSIEASTAEKAQLTSDIAQSTKDRDDAEKAIAEAKEIRNKERTAFEKQDTQDEANAKAMKLALESLRKGVEAAFLQTPSANELRQLAMSEDLPEWDRKALTSFLSLDSDDSDTDGYAPESGEIIGIISQMHETTEKEIVENNAAEKKAIEDFNSLVSAKTHEASALSKDIESKNARLGQVGVELVNLKQDLEDTTKLLKKDRDFLADLKHGCDTKQMEWAERTRTRSDELIALADTIQILNDDAATHLFKRTMATPSFLQLEESSSSKDVVQDAQQVLKQGEPGQREDPRLSVISLAMRGKKVNFDKVIGMIDAMVGLLQKEQQDDDGKRAYCKEEIAKAEDEKSTLEEDISNHQKTIANQNQMVETLIKEIKAIVHSIRVLDNAVDVATKQRQKEHMVFSEEMAGNNAAVQILGIAKDRLSKFYNPKAASLISAKRQHRTRHAKKVVHPAPARTGVAAVQEAFSFVQTSADHGTSGRAAPPPPPKAEFSAKGDGKGIIGLLDTLIMDTQKQVAEAQAEEKDAQFAYEQQMNDSAEKRAAYNKQLSAKEAEKAEAEAVVQKRRKEQKSSEIEAKANGEYLGDLHKECDWLLEHYQKRQEARTSEIASLRQAKNVVSGVSNDGAEQFLQLRQDVKRHLRKNSDA